MTTTTTALPPPHIDRWIDCYRSIGEAPLPAWLRERLEHDRRRARRRVWLPWLLPVLGFVLPLAGVILVIALAPKQQDLFMAMMVALLAAPLLGGGLALLLSKDGITIARRARRDLKHGRVERFLIDEAVLMELSARRSLGMEAPSLPLELLVLPVSSRLAARDNEPLAKLEPITIAKLARMPADAALQPVEVRTSAPAAPGRPGELEAYATAQRPLMEGERQELRTLRRRLMTPWFWLPVPLVFIVLGALSLYHGQMSTGRAIMWAFWLVTGTFSLWRAAHSARAWRSIGRDLADGRILVLDTEALRSLLRAHGETPPPVLPDYAEHLARSGMVWTSDGVPAPWRMKVQEKGK